MATEFAKQSERLGYLKPSQESEEEEHTQAVEAKFITAHDPIIETANGGRLPAVPLEEALKLNRLKDELDGKDPNKRAPLKSQTRHGKDGSLHGIIPPRNPNLRQSTKTDAPLRLVVGPTRTNPLFPPLPTYGPPSFMRDFQCLIFRVSSGILSFLFLLAIVLGSFFVAIPSFSRHFWYKLTFRDPLRHRKFYEEEKIAGQQRSESEREWQQPNGNLTRPSTTGVMLDDLSASNRHSNHDYEKFIPTEGGPDRLLCDVGYYARRVGLDCETFDVQTEDGFIIELLHLYNPLTTSPRSEEQRKIRSPGVFLPGTNKSKGLPPSPSPYKYPVLLIHGLLQSPGAYCCSDDSSLAFYLAKSGLDVWLGSNRCGFNPRHTLLTPKDPRMWSWNIRQMGNLDLPALISRVLHETKFPKLALIAHSQGTTETLVALAKEQRPEIGAKISIVCLLAPAAYAGRLISKMQFKFMRVISPGMFRAMFGIHAFIPFMISMHRLLPGKIYGWMGYRVFSFLFNWTDDRWDRGIRDRFFQFSPVYVSAESMRWWLGRECFASQKCILATREEANLEDAEEEQLEEDEMVHLSAEELKKYSWYNEMVPPFALWIGGSDALVDGKRLLRRFQRGREPFVRLVHSKVIEEYEHLDVIWAMDSIKQVGHEVLECIWKTVPTELKPSCRVPAGC